MFDHNYSEMDVAALKGMLTKRLVALHIITEDIENDRVKAEKDRQKTQAAFENTKEVIPKRELIKLLSMGRKEELAIRRHLENLKGSKEKDEDFRKRAEQIVLISLELRRRGVEVPEIDISKFHPRLQKAFREEFEKLEKAKGEKVRRLKAPRKKARRIRR